MGYDYLITEQIRLKTELYYQYLYNVPIDKDINAYSMLNQGAYFGIDVRDSLENKGLGKNYGIEITLEHFMKKGFLIGLLFLLFLLCYVLSLLVDRTLPCLFRKSMVQLFVEKL